MDADADARIKERLARDLDGGFADLVAAYGPTVRVTALRLTGHPEDAEDLAAECLLRAFRGLVDRPPEWVSEVDLRPWLLTILLNTWRNELRSRSRRPRTSGSAAIAPGASAEPTTRPDASPEVRAERASTRVDLAERLATLPTRQREAVVLRHVLDLPVAEVARILGTPEGTAKSHVSRGLAALRAGYLHSPEPEGSHR